MKRGSDDHWITEKRMTQVGSRQRDDESVSMIQQLPVFEGDDEYQKVEGHRRHFCTHQKTDSGIERVTSA